MKNPKGRRHFKVAQLKPELVAQVHALLEAGHTYGEIARHLHALGQDVSTSAVQRYGQHFLERERRLQETAEKAARLVGTVGNTDLEEAATRLALELLVRRLLDLEAMPDDLDVLGALHALAKMQTAAVTREKWKTDVAKRAAAAASDAAAIAKQGGLSDSAVEMIRSRILGLAEEMKP
jgi:hypothetical protein